MSIYRTVIVPRGGKRYRKDNQFVKQANIPANIFAELQAGKEAVDDTGVKLEGAVRTCLFDGQVCKLSRLVNLRTANLCEEHYYGKTLGQVAQKLNEVDAGLPA